MVSVRDLRERRSVVERAWRDDEDYEMIAHDFGRAKSAFRRT